MSTKESEVSQQTKTNYGTIREQLERTENAIDRRIDELKQKVAERFAPRRRTVDDLPLSAVRGR